MSTALSTLPSSAPAANAVSASPAQSDAERKRVADAALQFEAMFLLQMLKQMRQSMLQDESEEPGLGAGTMFDTVDAQLSKYLAGQPGGLSPMLMKAMSAPVETSGAPTGNPEALLLNPPTTALPLTGSAALPLPAGTTGVTAPVLTGAKATPTVTSEFGWRKDPFTGASKFHKGVDLKASYGQAVSSAGSGRVVFAGTQRGYGETVVVEHAPGLRTRYAHLSAIDVQEGQAVAAGESLGRVGKSGQATGPHLHFEVLKDGKAVDPASGGQLLAAGLKETVVGADYPTGSAGPLAGRVSGVEE